MTVLDLYKFVTNNELEWHEHKNDEGRDDVLLFIPHQDIRDIADLLGNGIFDEAGIQCHWKGHYICVWMEPVCEYFGIDLWEVFEKGASHG